MPSLGKIVFTTVFIVLLNSVQHTIKNPKIAKKQVNRMYNQEKNSRIKSTGVPDSKN